MGTHDILHPAGWKPTAGYSSGVVATGKTIFLAGMIGWDNQQQFVGDDFVAQAAQALRNIVEVLAEANAGPEHVVRLTWYVTDRDEYLACQKQLGEAYREVFGKHFPAMTMVQVRALVEPRAKVEIEATAVVP
jgi:enamine deaminase RidA (YjgF/YER057c/UK114 family)